MAKHRRKASPAQIAARKAFAAKYGGKKRKAAKASRPKTHRRKRRLGVGKHRPVVIVSKSRRLRRPKRSSIPAHARFSNPFMGSLAMIGGNPMSRKRKSSRKSHRRSHRRSSSRGLRLFSNPASALGAVTAAPKEMISKTFLMEASGVAVGFLLPNATMALLPAALQDARWKRYASKVAVVAVLSGATSLVSKRASKAVLLGGGVSILLDLYAEFVLPMLRPSLPASGTSAFYGNPGDPGVDAFFGNPGDPGVSGLNDGAAIGEAFA